MLGDVVAVKPGGVVGFGDAQPGFVEVVERDVALVEVIEDAEAQPISPE